MYHCNDKCETTRPPRERGPTAPAIRTYRQIAQVLGKREGRPVCPERVELLCRNAEWKLAKALLADPVLKAWLGTGVLRAPLPDVAPEPPRGTPHKPESATAPRRASYSCLPDLQLSE